MNKELLRKYFSGRCTPFEEDAVRAYLDKDDLSDLHEYIDELGLQAKDELSPEIKEEQLRLLHLELRKRAMVSRFPFRRFSVAASIALVCALSAGGLYWSTLNKNEGKVVTWTTFSNPSNKVKHLTLPDGTSIWLNENSSLSYNSAAYNKEDREVKITGEGYFDVAHDTRHPFIVHAGKITTTVLGTAFNIESYPNEQHVRVILVRGKVRVHATASDRILKPGQMLSFRKDNKKIEVTGVSTNGISDWSSGKFIFSSLPLTDVFKRIERAYNIQISYPHTEAIEQMTLTGSYTRSTPDELLKKVLFVHGLKYKKEGAHYTIIKP